MDKLSSIQDIISELEGLQNRANFIMVGLNRIADDYKTSRVRRVGDILADLYDTCSEACEELSDITF